VVGIFSRFAERNERWRVRCIYL